MPHGVQGVIIEERSHPLPQPTFAAQFGPHRLEQRAAQLLDLIHAKREHHQHGKHHGKMLIAMAIIGRWREIKCQYIGALGSVAAIKNVSPRDNHGSFDPLTLHKRCRCTPEFRASDYI